MPLEPAQVSTGSTPEGLTPDFDSIAAADRAYFGGEQTDPDGDGQPDPTGWGDPETVPAEFSGGWNLIRQPRLQDPSERRYLVIRVTGDGVEQALNEGGTPEDVSLSMPLEGVPTFGTEQDAREAYKAWQEQRGADKPDDGGNVDWGEWAKLTEIPPWIVWGREHDSQDRMQMLAAGKLSDGTAVYLQSDGSVGEQAHIFTNPDDLQAALDAYSTKVDNGDIPKEQQPTGDSPNSRTISQAGGKATGGAPPSGGSAGGGGPLSMLTSSTGMIGALVLIAAIYYAYSQGYLDTANQTSSRPTQA